ncbi:tetratricopeptide repeat protein [Thiobaca trueperi]|uniref:Tetratricopeptide repeat protein n=1 Tax=Thiobaca trueperi TaxID=127458 RepID=A0A4R3N4C8_9GAMM|nr:tetratricopeptide repeat protein [Thiobaca trueperi]TCT24028.1 tetratricopeptide repeat protein [Thiobaca trueperi]
MSAIPVSPAVERWSARLATDPVQAMGDLLAGRLFLGPFARARPSEALVQLLTPDEMPLADRALRAWLEQVIGAPARDDLPGKRFADALSEAFRAVSLVPLRESRAWCTQHQGQLRSWLRGFYFGHSRDPEAALLVALTGDQRDRHLLGLWLGLARLSGGVSEDYGRLAITGLRLMPADDAGEIERSVPVAMLRGVLDFGEALARRGDLKGKTWLAELDYLAAVYPMSTDQWGRRFRDLVQARDVSATVRKWLDQRYPGALRPFDPQQTKGFLQAPHQDELRQLLRQLPANLTAIRPQLEALFDRHRQYCRESGDSYYLVRAFCFAGDRLLNLDPTWARDLAHEAARWNPQDPYPWSLLARALEAEGDWHRAQAVYWHARRRFPHNVHSHSQLAHALIVHGDVELGEAVYDTAIGLFPSNPYCRADLAHTLRVTGRPQRAVEVYREAQQHFPQDPAIIVGLVNTLIDLERLGEAKAVLDWADQLGMDERSAAKREQVQRRLQQARNGQPVRPAQPRQPDEGRAGDLAALADITGEDLAHDPALGRAILLRRSGGDDLARAWSEIQTLPAGTVQLIETGLWRARSDGWRSAADWFDQTWGRYAGDGVLRVHRNRAHARVGDAVDWSLERERYPYLATVIETEINGEPPARIRHIDPTDQDLTEEQRQDAWFLGLMDKADPSLRDTAEEDLLSARHLLV